MYELIILFFVVLHFKFYFKEKGKIKNDTITLMLGNSIEEIYKKKTIPKEFLEGWEPDW